MNLEAFTEGFFKRAGDIDPEDLMEDLPVPAPSEPQGPAGQGLAKRVGGVPVATTQEAALSRITSDPYWKFRDSHPLEQARFDDYVNNYLNMGGYYHGPRPGSERYAYVNPVANRGMNASFNRANTLAHELLGHALAPKIPATGLTPEINIGGSETFARLAALARVGPRYPELALNRMVPDLVNFTRTSLGTGKLPPTDPLSLYNVYGGLPGKLTRLVNIYPSETLHNVALSARAGRSPVVNALTSNVKSLIQPRNLASMGTGLITGGAADDVMRQVLPETQGGSYLADVMKNLSSIGVDAGAGALGGAAAGGVPGAMLGTLGGLTYNVGNSLVKGVSDVWGAGKNLYQADQTANMPAPEPHLSPRSTYSYTPEYGLAPKDNLAKVNLNYTPQKPNPAPSLSLPQNEPTTPYKRPTAY